MEKQISKEMRDALQSVSERFMDVRGAMADAIHDTMKEILEQDGHNKVVFYGSIDCATCEPIKSLVYDAQCREVFAMPEDNDSPTAVSELTGNELWTMVQCLMAGNYLFEGEEE